jgi:plastocyanin
VVGAALALGAGACAAPERASRPVDLGGGAGSPSPTATEEVRAAPPRVDPRTGGFEIGFGEYAVTLEAPAIRPGPVTFVVTNGGKLVHGFEMAAEGGDSSGPGSGDGFKIERPSFRPGQTIRIPLDLATGVYKIECWVANHDDLGMQILLEVRPDASKVRQATAGGDAVSIQGFAFEPPALEISPGTGVTWTNEDPEAHTVTAEDGSFDSGPIEPGRTFSVRIEETGRIAYVCRIHSLMTGTLRVT